MMRVRLFRAGKLEDDDLAPERIPEVLATEDARVWLDLEDPTDHDLELLADRFGLHALSLEDMRHRDQRAKVESYPTYTFLVVRPLGLVGDELVEQELHGLVGDRFLATVRYEPAVDVGKAVHRAVGGAELTEEGIGFLLYVVLDEIVDDYLEIVERFEDDADEIEDRVFATESSAEEGALVQERVFRLKRDVVDFRRQVMPLRRVLDFLLEERRIVSPSMSPYFRDVADHVLRATELADNVRDLLTSLLEVRMAQVGNRLNEVMKKLTAWAGIILIPTLIAGIYGMNFAHMPELGWRYGYLYALALMATPSVVLFVMFKRRDWL